MTLGSGHQSLLPDDIPLAVSIDDHAVPALAVGDMALAPPDRRVGRDASPAMGVRRLRRLPVVLSVLFHAALAAAAVQALAPAGFETPADTVSVAFVDEQVLAHAMLQAEIAGQDAETPPAVRPVELARLAAPERLSDVSPDAVAVVAGTPATAKSPEMAAPLASAEATAVEAVSQETVAAVARATGAARHTPAAQTIPVTAPAHRKPSPVASGEAIPANAVAAAKPVDSRDADRPDSLLPDTAVAPASDAASLPDTVEGVEVTALPDAAAIPVPRPAPDRPVSTRQKPEMEAQQRAPRAAAKDKPARTGEKAAKRPVETGETRRDREPANGRPRGRAATGETGAGAPAKGDRQAAAKAPAGSGPANPGAKAAYSKKLLAHVQRHKRYPSEAQRQKVSGSSRLQITIDRGGRLVGARVAASSGHTILDSEALAAARRAAPYPRPPEGVGAGTLTFAVTFRFGR